MTTVLIALHYQNEVLHERGKIRVGIEENSPQRRDIIQAAMSLLQQARHNNIPIVHVRVAYRKDYADLPHNAPIFNGVRQLQAVQEGSWGCEFYKGLEPLIDCEREFVITHNRINAFYSSQLEAVLQNLTPSRLVIAGVATHSVVESTVRHAVDMGYKVIVPAAACGAPPAMHEASLNSMRLIASIYPKACMSTLFGEDEHV